MKKKTNLRYKIGILILTLVLLSAYDSEAQSRKRLRELDQMEKGHEAEEESAEAEAKQRHLDIQSKQTRKEMKNYQKMSKRYNTNRREPFYKKWFRRNRR
jgi:hypothetical protein